MMPLFKKEITAEEAAELANQEIYRLNNMYGDPSDDSDPRVMIIHGLELFVNGFSVDKLLWMTKINVHVTELPKFKRLDLDNNAIIVSRSYPSFAHMVYWKYRDIE